MAGRNDIDAQLTDMNNLTVILTNIQHDIKQIKDHLGMKDVTSKESRQLFGQSMEETIRKSNLSTVEDDMLSETGSTSSMGSTPSDDGKKEFAFRTKCMSEGIRLSFMDVIRCVPFEEIVDEILSKGLMTTSENLRIRELDCQEDRMRSLVRNVMDKDYNIMETFLDLIGTYDPAVKRSIQITFNDRYNEELSNKKGTDCTVCLIKRRVNIKLVCDHYFSRGIITPELHQDVTNTLSSARDKTTLWQRLFEELSAERAEYTMSIMRDALMDGEGEQLSFHTDIVQRIDRDVKRHRATFKCRCRSKSSRKRKLPFDSITKPKQPVLFSGLQARPVSVVSLDSVANATAEISHTPDLNPFDLISSFTRRWPITRTPATLDAFVTTQKPVPKPLTNREYSPVPMSLTNREYSAVPKPLTNREYSPVPRPLTNREYSPVPKATNKQRVFAVPKATNKQRVLYSPFPTPLTNRDNTPRCDVGSLLRLPFKPQKDEC